MSEHDEPFRDIDEHLAGRAGIPVRNLCVDLGGLRVHALDRRQWATLFRHDLDRMRESRFENRPLVLTSANGNVLSLSARSERYRALLDEVDAVDADGMSLVFASRWLGTPALPERVATTDLVHDLAREGADARACFYLLGGTAEVNRLARRRLERDYPGLTVVGRDGYFAPDQESTVFAEIESLRPDLVLVGLGVPRELELALKLRDALTGVTWIKTCGGLFDFLSGRNKRAPSVLQRLGMEWAYRAWLEPQRLLWRYVSTNSHTIYLLARQRLAPARGRRS
jgi:exopolysaccharide biosynthesis WecB/TagA/CpsF family protein